MSDSSRPSRVYPRRCQRACSRRTDWPSAVNAGSSLSQARLTEASSATAAGAAASIARSERRAAARARLDRMAPPLPAFRAALPLAREAQRDDPVGLEAEAEALPVLGLHRVQAGQLLDPLKAVGNRMAMRVDRRGGRIHVAVL